MGIFLSALAAAGDAGVQSMNQNIQQQNQIDQQNNQAGLQATADQRRSDLELQKAKAIADYNDQLKNAPLQRFSDVAAQKANEQVPVDAPPVTALDQSSADASGLQSGIQGNMQNISALASQAQGTLSNPNATSEQKTNAQGILDQVKTQLSAQKQAAIDSVQGQTRPRNSDEVIRDSLAQLRTTDPKAYADAMASGVLQSKYITVAKDTTLFDPTTNKPIYTNNSGQDAADEKEDRKDLRQQALFEHQMNLQDKRESLKAKNVQDKNDPWKIFTDSNGDQVQGLPHGDEFLNMLPEQAKGQVKALAEGRLSFPTGAAMRSPASQNLIAAVAQYDPTFDAANFNKRNKTAIDFSSGESSKQVKAANQTIAHMGKLYDAIVNLDNFNGLAAPANYIVNPVQKFFGGSKQGTFSQDALAVSSELRKVFAGSGGGGLTELKAWEDSIPSNASRDAQETYLKNGIELLHGAVVALDDKYRQGMGLIADKTPLLSESSRKTLERIGAPPMIQSSNQPSPQTNQATDNNSGWSNLRVH